MPLQSVVFFFQIGIIMSIGALRCATKHPRLSDRIDRVFLRMHCAGRQLKFILRAFGKIGAGFVVIKYKINSVNLANGYTPTRSLGTH